MLTNAPLTKAERERLQRELTITWTWEKLSSVGGALDALADMHEERGNTEMAKKVSDLADEFSDLYRQALKSEHKPEEST